jgi:hypothetical protein
LEGRFRNRDNYCDFEEMHKKLGGHFLRLHAIQA